MEKLCPLCNGLAEVEDNCPRCGGRLADGGAVGNYFGPYSPYMDIGSWPGRADDGRCLHLLYCPACGYDVRRAWPVVSV